MSRSKPASETGTHLPFLDALRGMAALGVVLYHSRDNIVTTVPSLITNPLYRVLAFGNLGVEVFFVVSGYCIVATAVDGLRKNRGILAFVKARARRIFPPYWFSLVVRLAIAWLLFAMVRHHVIASSNLADLAEKRFGALYYVANVSLTQLVVGEPFISIVAWTLCYEAAFYAICSLGLLVASRIRADRELWLLRALHGVTVCVLIAHIAIPGRLGYPLDMWAMFGLGAALYHLVRAERREPAEARESGIAFGAIVLLTLGMMARGAGSTVSPFQHAVPLAFGVALGAVGLLWAVRKMTSETASSGLLRPLSAVGVFSYSLYLIHFMCIGMTNQALRIVKVPDSAHLVRLAAMVGVSLLGGWLFFLIAERPYLRSRKDRSVHPTEPVPVVATAQ